MSNLKINKLIVRKNQAIYFPGLHTRIILAENWAARMIRFALFGTEF